MSIKSVFQRVWTSWKRVGQFIGDAIARVVLTAFYFTILVPFALMSRLMRRSTLPSGDGSGFWMTRTLDQDDLGRARRLH